MTPYVSHSEVLEMFAEQCRFADRRPIRVNAGGPGFGWGWTCHRCCTVGVCYGDHTSALVAALDHCKPS